ncbi:MAG: excisionase family DNA-binding protein [Candidatus Omnitrophica bacterium]|nr:excisionase family DNA-binding protein [Candidatus Omnitrophota bacterium]
MSPQYFTTSQAAELLHVTRFTVLNWIKKGKIKAVATLGGHQRIPKKSIADLLTQEQSIIQTPADISPKTRRTTFSAQKANISRMFKRGAYVSGKYIASMKSGVSHILTNQ